MSPSPEPTAPTAPSPTPAELETLPTPPAAESDAPDSADEDEPSAEPKEAHEDEDDEEATDAAPTLTAPLPTEQPPLPDEPAPPPPGAGGGVHSKDDWQAIWSADAAAYYFFNSKTNKTTWDNPLAPAASTSAQQPQQPQPALPSASVPPDSTPTAEQYGGIDPDLAYLDPSLSRFASRTSTAPSFAGHFNAKTGRFQASGPGKRVENKQEEHYYDSKGWRESLEGKGLGRGAEEEGEGEGSAKRLKKGELRMFKEQKERRKKAKLSAWLGK